MSTLHVVEEVAGALRCSHGDWEWPAVHGITHNAWVTARAHERHHNTLRPPPVTAAEAATEPSRDGWTGD